MCNTVINIEKYQLRFYQEWLRSTDSPESDDIFTMARFLTDLVSARNLCLVEVFIKCFQRNISNLKNCGTWWTALAGLVAQAHNTFVIIQLIYISKIFS